MFSQLHARRKGAPQDDGVVDAEAGSLSPPEDHHHKPTTTRRRKRALPREITYAFSTVTLFLAFGLFLGYVLIHHRHRKVIYHVLRDPVGHSRAVLQGRVGFRHHFYSGAPRFVTVVLPSVVRPDELHDNNSIMRQRETIEYCT